MKSIFVISLLLGLGVICAVSQDSFVSISNTAFPNKAFIYAPIEAEAQSTEMTTLSNINLYADGGFFPGVQASINLEKRISSGEKVTWYGRVGGGVAGIMMSETGGPGMLAAVTMLTGKEKNHFEINGGAFVGKNTESDDMYFLPLIDLGYRYQKPQGGFIFRAKAGFLGIGISLGYAF